MKETWRVTFPANSPLIRESLMRRSTNFGHTELVCLGVCFGRFTKSKNFRLHITCLDVIARYAPVGGWCCAFLVIHLWPNSLLPQYKVWVKSSHEMSFLYGNHVLKVHVLGRNFSAIPQQMNKLPIEWSGTHYGGHTTISGRNNIEHARCATWYGCIEMFVQPLAVNAMFCE